MSKSKITVFRKGGLLAADEVWRYGDEVLNNYKWVPGVVFYHQIVRLTQVVGDLAAKAKVRTSQMLKCLWRLGNVPRTVFEKKKKCMMPRSYRFFCVDLSYGVSNSLQWQNKRTCLREKNLSVLAYKQFVNVSVQTPNWSVVTWADILCLLHLLYDV